MAFTQDVGDWVGEWTAESNALVYAGDDDERRNIIATLEANLLAPRVAENQQTALAVADAVEIECVIISLRAPHAGLAEIISGLRSISEAPVLVILDEGAEEEIVRALDDGADALLTRPFSLRELAAVARALVRRDRKRGTRNPRPQRLGRFVIDERGRTVTAGGEHVALTRTEFDLLLHLVRNRHRVVDRNELMRDVWATRMPARRRIVDAHVSTLRAKLEEDPSRPQHLVTVRHHGYQFVS
jgi:DNA-binding response OmpR family regulator